MLCCERASWGQPGSRRICATQKLAHCNYIKLDPDPNWPGPSLPVRCWGEGGVDALEADLRVPVILRVGRVLTTRDAPDIKSDRISNHTQISVNQIIDRKQDIRQDTRYCLQKVRILERKNIKKYDSDPSFLKLSSKTQGGKNNSELSWTFF